MQKTREFLGNVDQRLVSNIFCAESNEDNEHREETGTNQLQNAIIAMQNKEAVAATDVTMKKYASVILDYV